MTSGTVPGQAARPAAPAGPGGDGATRRRLPPVPPRPLDRRAAAATVALVLAGAALAAQRHRGVGALHTLWAEDGAVFLGDALHRPVLDTLLRPYNGYLHLLPRVVGAAAAALPLSAAAAVLSGAGALGAAAAAAVGYHAGAPHLRSRLVRLVLAAFVTLAPVAAAEAANSTANLQWYLVYAGFWVLLWDGRRALDLAVASLVLAAAALSAPLSVLLLPVLAVRLAVLRARVTLPVGCFLAGLAVQLLAVAGGHGGRTIDYHITWPETLIEYVRGVAGLALLDTPGWRASPALTAAGWAVLAAGLLAGAVTAARRPRRAWLLGLLLATSLLAYLVPVRVSGYAVSRYLLVPGLLLVAALGVCADDLLARAAPGRARAGLGAALVAAAGLALAASYPTLGPRGAGPSWEDGLRGARGVCAAGAATATVPITPAGTRHGWSVRVPCRRLGPPG